MLRNGPERVRATLERREPVAIAVGLPPLPRLGRSWGASTPAPLTFRPESDDSPQGRQPISILLADVAICWKGDVVTAVRGLDARAGGSASRLARRSRCERGNHCRCAACSRSIEVRWKSALLWRARSARSFARPQQKDASIRYSPAPSTTRTSAAACPCTGQELARIVVVCCSAAFRSSSWAPGACQAG
jgi:hypothetical protein